MKKKLRIGLRYFSLIAISMMMGAPLAWMFVTSLKTQEEAVRSKFSLHVSNPQWSNYIKVFKEYNFDSYIANTLFVALTISVVTVILAALAAYALNFTNFKGRKLVFVIFIFSMFLPTHMTLIPGYILLAKFQWLDTFRGLIIPSCISGFSIFLMNQGFKQMPKSIIEAAKCDGASHLSILFRIVLPLMVPTMITLGIITFTYQYNSYTWPLIITSGERVRTVSLALAKFVQNEGGYGTQWSQMMAANTVSILPVLILFLVLQKYYVKGVMHQGLKD